MAELVDALSDGRNPGLFSSYSQAGLGIRPCLASPGDRLSDVFSLIRENMALIPFRVVNSREQDRNMLLQSRLPAQEREFSIRSTIENFPEPVRLCISHYNIDGRR